VELRASLTGYRGGLMFLATLVTMLLIVGLVFSEFKYYRTVDVE
jgi:hypothetical protein